MSDKFVIGQDARSRADKGDGSRASARGSYNTIQPKPAQRPARSFRTRMTIFFGLTAILTAVILSAMLVFSWESAFQGYTRQNMQRTADTLASNLAASYEQAGGQWSREVNENISSVAEKLPDVVVQVLDKDERVLYDDTLVSSKGKQSGGAAAGTPDNADSVVSSFIYASDGVKVGTVRLWAFGSDALLTKADASFREHSFTAILYAALAAVLLACIIGYFVSRALTKPIQVITSTARQIRNGDLTARTGLAGDDEIGLLAETFDEMATSLERDIKHERRLTGDVAHELRTPLMAIQATVEAMEDKVLPADEEHLGIVDSEVKRLSRLVDAMLRLSRIENGTRRFQPERTDVVYLVRSLVSMQERLFAEKDIRLRFDDHTPYHELYVEVDPDGVREAVTNLLSNAMRYTSEGGWVVVSVKQDRGDVLIAVKDTGMGIAKEDIPKTFSRFWRSDASRERVSGGLGVGLAITKGIVDLHNGTISVESELGKGTTFTLRLPCEQGRREKQAEQGEE